MKKILIGLSMAMFALAASAQNPAVKVDNWVNLEGEYIETYLLDGVQYAIVDCTKSEYLKNHVGEKYQNTAVVWPRVDKYHFEGHVIIPEKVLLGGKEYPVKTYGGLWLAMRDATYDKNLEITLPETIEQVMGFAQMSGRGNIKSINP